MMQPSRRGTDRPDRPLVISVGEVLWDCFPDRKVLGGAPFNVACMAQQLGAESRMISRVGDDADGAAILDRMRELGMSAELIQRDAAHATGAVRVAVSPTGEPAFTIIEDVAYDHLEWQDRLAEPLGRCRAVCFGTLAQRNAASRTAIGRMLDAAPHALKVYDVNLRQHFYSPEILSEGLRRAQVVKLNDGELALLKELFSRDWSGGPAHFMARYGIELLAITRGADGCTLYRGEESVEAPGFRVKIRDTVGSGDAFTAGMITACLAGAGLREIGETANLWGAYVATKQGGTPRIDAAEAAALKTSAGRGGN